jgi:hypothetical protein
MGCRLKSLNICSARNRLMAGKYLLYSVLIYSVLASGFLDQERPIRVLTNMHHLD